MDTTTIEDVAAAARALGVRDVVARGGRLVTLRAVLADAQRMRWDALHASVALDALFPRQACTWRGVCFLCVIPAGARSAAPADATCWWPRFPMSRSPTRPPRTSRAAAIRVAAAAPWP